MGDMKDKVKDMMKKVNNPFSSTSGKFKGQGRTLGSSSPGPTNPIPGRPSQPLESRLVSKKPTASSSNSKPAPQKSIQTKSPESISTVEDRSSSNPRQPPANGFDPFGALITTSERNKNGYSLNVFECPICKGAFGSEEKVSVHIESCVDISRTSDVAGGDCVDASPQEVNCVNRAEGANSELEACVGAYVSGRPSESSLKVVLRLLRNIIKEPENAKFRRIRMSNPKIREAVSEVSGCVDLLQFLGFVLVEEEGELWAVMETPSEENISMLELSISLLEPNEARGGASPSPKVVEPNESKAVDHGSNNEIKTFDRQTRIFFSVSESVAARIDLPESFYKLSVDEVRRESEQRKKKLAESQLLIPRSYKEKQAKAARSRYTKTIIRVQFPDGVVLQGTFSPHEPTSALYEFVSSSLKEPSLEFELMHPIPVKRRVIPCFAGAGEKVATLDGEDLVPAALVKFKPFETEDIVFTGLRNDLLEKSEPLSNDPSASGR